MKFIGKLVVQNDFTRTRSFTCEEDEKVAEFKAGLIGRELNRLVNRGEIKDYEVVVIDEEIFKALMS